MNLLAIDPATRTGWATKDAWGVWNLRRRKDESDGVKWLRFKARLKEIIDLADISIIVYERPSGRHTGAVIHHSKLVAMIEALCAELELEYKGYSSTEIKKFATGRGNASKTAMIKAAKEIGYNGHDDNEADAIWLYKLAADDLGI